MGDRLTPAESKVLLVSEVARRLRVKPRHVLKHLPIKLIGGKKRIFESDLDKYLSEHTQDPVRSQRLVASREHPDQTLARLRAEGIAKE